MSVLSKDRAVVVRNRGVVVGSCPDCCGGAPCDYYYRYIPCPVGPPPGGCGPSIPSGAGVIYVHAGTRCAGGLPLCQSIVTATPPVIIYAGKCWGMEITLQCLTYVRANPSGSQCLLPCAAIVPGQQELVCVPDPGCEHPRCTVESYILAKLCPGSQGSGPVPQVYVCGDQIAAALNSGIRCPSSRLTGNHCVYWDWTNPVEELPAGYSPYLGTFGEGCCACIGPPCVLARAHRCPGQIVYPGECCAHEINGSAVLRYYAKGSLSGTGGTSSQEWIGQAVRSGGRLRGTVRRIQVSPGSTLVEDFDWDQPIAGDFTLISMLGSNPIGTQGFFPCGVPDPSNCPGVTAETRVTGNCYFHQMQSGYECIDQTGTTVRLEASMAYVCSPSPGVCGDGCDLTNPQTPGQNTVDPVGPVPTPCLDEPGPGDAVLVGALEVLGV